MRVILNRKHEKQLAERFVRYVVYEKSCYRIPIDDTIITAISYHLTKDLVPSGLCNNTTAENIALALQEAITNAMFHGCLEVSSSIREEHGIKGYNDEIEKRKADDRYRDRHVTISYELNRDYVEYMIEDEGPGFDYNALPDPRDPGKFFQEQRAGASYNQDPHGRGGLE